MEYDPRHPRRRRPLADVHITVELLRAVMRGDLPPRVLVEIGLDHLTGLCPHCRNELRAWRDELKRGTARAEATLRVLPSLLERHARDAEATRDSVERDFREILALDHAERLRRVRRATRRFRGVSLAARLLDESKKVVPADPRSAYELAETAEAVLRQTPAAPGLVDLFARAAAFLGNALRAQGRLQEARPRFELARFFIQQEGVTDLSLIAEIDSCEGVLALDQRRLADAERLLTRSIHLYTVARDRPASAHPRLTLGRLHALRGEYVQAIESARSAAEAAGAGDRRLALYARHNQATYLCEIGSFETAAATVQEARDLYQGFPDPFTQLRLAWVEGKIAAGLGRPEDAERAFRIVRQGFLDRALSYDAALVSIDLALLYARQSRTAELKTLAEEMHPLFAAEDLHQEAAAALLFFQEAARQEAVTVGLLEELAAYLKAARGNPRLRFRGRLVL
jgi:hypothetical protein